MNIDKQLEVLRKALEGGAHIQIDFFNSQKKQAEEVVKEYSTLLQEEPIEWNGVTTDGIRIGSVRDDIQVQFYFNKEKQSDVG